MKKQRSNFDIPERLCEHGISPEEAVDILISSFSDDKGSPSTTSEFTLVRWTEIMNAKGAFNNSVPADTFVDTTINAFRVLAIRTKDNASEQQNESPMGDAGQQNISSNHRARIVAFVNVTTQLLSRARLEALCNAITSEESSEKTVADIISRFDFDLTSPNENVDTEVWKSLAGALQSMIGDEVIPVPSGIVIKSVAVYGKANVQKVRKTSPLHPAPFGAIVFE